MRTSFVRMLVPVALLAAACGRGTSESSAVPDDLKKDLEASTPGKLELANQSAGYQPMRFVSELEQTNASTPVQRTQAPRRVAANSAGAVPENKVSPTPEPANEVQVAETPAEMPQAPAPEPDVPRVPTVAPRPAALPVDVPVLQGDGGRGGYGDGGIGSGREGRGDGPGGIIGVVIRGGGVGPDHCPPRRRGRPRFPINPLHP